MSTEKVKFTWAVEKKILLEMKKKALEMDKPLSAILTNLCIEFLARK